MSILFALLLSINNFALHIGESTWIDGHFSAGQIDRLKQQHDDFVFFEQDGRRYLVTDSRSLERIEQTVAPIHEIGRKQGALGREQGKLGREQGRIGREQGRIGREQARAAREDDRDRLDALDAQMRALAAQQQELGEQQRELGERQRELGERMRETKRRVDRDLEKLLSELVRQGTAKRYSE